MYKSRDAAQENGGRWGHSSAPVVMSPESAQAADVFEKFIGASTFKSVLNHHRQICELLRLRPNNIRHFYPKLRNKLKSWKAQAVWAKFDKRASHKCYNHGKACANTKVLIIGAGPCGLRTAIEAQLLGAQVVVVEKRDRFSRNNVLHLWPFVIADLKALGAKKFYGKFCAGAIDHISIRQLQCILLKVALLLGVRVFESLAFEELIPPPEDQSEKIGWRARFSQPEHSLHQYEFDVLIGADGKRNTLSGFKRTEFRGKLAIAVTANFINKRTEVESSVQEISGVAFIFNQKFFKELRAATGIDLENIVYYKDETHYFVMTAKKQSLIDKGVILEDLPDTQQLLHPNNVDREALQDYAREAADFSTNYQMPHLDFAVNHYGHPDVAMFDFTSMFAAENACQAHQIRGHRLLMALVGDSLLEPFWPTGSGCARGFLSAFDSAWMIRSWASLTPDGSLLDVLAERESIYRLLAQTTPGNLAKDHHLYTLEPSSRYPTINTRAVLPFQVRHLLTTDDPTLSKLPTMIVAPAAAGVNPSIDECDDQTLSRKRKRRGSLVDPNALVNWCQRQVSHLPGLSITDLTTSFKNGLALCGILHRYRPELIPFEKLSADDVALNNQIAFDALESEFGIPPIMTGSEMAGCEVPDKLTMVSYLSQVHHMLRGEVPYTSYNEDLVDDELNDPVIIDARAPRGFTCRLTEEPTLYASSLDKKTKKSRSERVVTEEGRADLPDDATRKAASTVVDREDFDERVKYLESKFKGEPHSHYRTDKKPKDMVRAIGKIERSDWNIAAIERKIKENPSTEVSQATEKVPKWSKDAYEDKLNSIEQRMRANGEKEETIAKYKDVDAYLKRLEKKLREGSTLDVGLKGHNKVSNLASQLSSKLTHPAPLDKPKNAGATKAPVVVQLPTTASDLCFFCGTRVYLVERLSAEGKFFHRHCFRCQYCNVLLRLGNYIYDREGRYGGKFFCIPHFGLTASSSNTTTSQQPRRGITAVAASGQRVADDARAVAPSAPSSHAPTPGRRSIHHTPIKNATSTPSTREVLGKISGGAIDLDDRGTTPERVEFENSLLEQGSDEEEYLSEEEWTDRNFGASTNEHDDTSNGSEYSDSSDEEVIEELVDGDEEEEDEEEVDEEQVKRVKRTRRPAPRKGGGGGTLSSSPNEAVNNRTKTKAWQYNRQQSKTDSNDETESDLESDDYSEEHGADGDESHTATEGELGGDDDEDCEYVRKERERRMQEIKHSAPLRHEDTSDTEVASDEEESEESDTQIDTDSEFGEEDNGGKDSGRLREIPKIVIENEEDHGQLHGANKENKVPRKIQVQEEVIKKVENTAVKAEAGGAEKSASMTSLADLSKSKGSQHISPAEQLRSRLMLQRTESNEALTSQKNLFLRRQYLLGQGSSLPKKSVSTADLGNRFKSFMEKISETQKMLNPAPQPSQEMQAYINSSNKNQQQIGGALSPLSPLSAHKQLLDKENNSLVVENTKDLVVTKGDLRQNERNLELNQQQQNEEKQNKNEDDREGDPNNSDHEMQLDFGEIKENTDDIIKENILAIDDGNGIDNMELMLANSDHVVETVNKELVDMKHEEVLGAHTAKNQTLTSADNSINVSLSPINNNSVVSTANTTLLQNLSSVPSDVDDLFEVLAKEAIDDPIGRSYNDSQDASSLSNVFENNTLHEDTKEGSSNKNNRELERQSSTPVNTSNEGQDLGNNFITTNKESNLTDTQKSYTDGVTSIASPTSEDISLSDKFDESSMNTAISLDILRTSNGVKSVPRMASVESLGDTDSIISTNLSSVRSLDKCSHKGLPDLPSGPPPPLMEDEVQIISEQLQDKCLMADSDTRKKKSTSSEFADIGFMDSNDEDASDEDKKARRKLDTGPPLTNGASSKVTNGAANKSTNDSLNTITTNIDLSEPKPEYIYQKIVDQTIDLSSSVSSPEEPKRKTNLNEVLDDSSIVEVFDDESSQSQINIHEPNAVVSCPEETAAVVSQTQNTHPKMSNEQRSMSTDSNETSSLTESSKSYERKYSGSGGSKEALLSSPELVKNVTYNSSRVNSTPTQSKPGEERTSVSVTSTASPRRYEGYIPRFKDHISPLSYTRDSYEARKDSSSKLPSYSSSSLFSSSSFSRTPDSKPVTPVAAAEVTPAAAVEVTTPSAAEVSSLSSVPDRSPALKKIEKNVLNTKKKDGDLVQQLVLSKIIRKTPQKGTRRGSRSTMSPQTSNENLLDDSRTVSDINGHTLSTVGNSNLSSATVEEEEEQKPATNLSERISATRQQSPLYTPKFSQYSPIESRCSRGRANTISTITRENKTTSLSNLPATPLTHPDQFKNISLGPKRDLFGAAGGSALGVSTPAIPQLATSLNHNKDLLSSPIGPLESSTPVSAVISGLDLERSGRRRELLSHNLPHTVDIKPFNSAHTASSDLLQMNDADVSLKNRSEEARLELAKLKDKAKEERLQELLAEQRAAAASARQRGQNVNEKVAERLQEFREKKEKSLPSLFVAPSYSPQQSGPSQLQAEEDSITPRDRPSMLQLESMQVFSRPQPSQATIVMLDTHSPPTAHQPRQPPPVSPRANLPSSMPPPHPAAHTRDYVPPAQTNLKPYSSTPSEVSVQQQESQSFGSNVATPIVTPPLSTSTPITSSPPPPLTPSQISASKAAASNQQQLVPKPTSGKKSKDRERRRSLIQVFAGMFKSSSSSAGGGGEEEKRRSVSVGESDSPSSSLSSPQPLHSTNSGSTSLVAPKSPATAVRDKLAKLRLPRSKDKGKASKLRSISSDMLQHTGTASLSPPPPAPPPSSNLSTTATNDAQHRMAFSLPTSPAHHPITAPPSTHPHHRHDSCSTASPPSLTYSSTTHSSSSSGGGRPLPLSLAPPLRPPYASGSGRSSPSFLNSNTPRIEEEESLTDDESSGRDGGGPSPRIGGGGLPPQTTHHHTTAASSVNAVASTSANNNCQRMKINKQSKEMELNRLRQAQEIQRQLEECEVKTRELEQRGILVEKSLRGEPGGESRDEADLMSEWFALVHEKTALSRYEQDLSIMARRLDLEDRDARLQQQLMEASGSSVNADRLLEELRTVRDERDTLKSMVEQNKLRYVEEDRDLETVMLRKGVQSPRETGV